MASSSVGAKPQSHGIEFMKRIATLFNNAEYSDVTLQIHDLTLPAHRLVICVQCKYFENAFNNFSEASTGIIKLDEGSGAAYWRVIDYLYTGNYSDQLFPVELEDDPELLKDIRVHRLADMMFIQGLKTLSEAKIRERLAVSVGNDGFADCIEEIYADSYPGIQQLRSVVINAAISRRADPEVQETVKGLSYKGGDFAVDYITALEKDIGNW